MGKFGTIGLRIKGTYFFQVYINAFLRNVVVGLWMYADIALDIVSAVKFSNWCDEV